MQDTDSQNGIQPEEEKESPDREKDEEDLVDDLLETDPPEPSTEKEPEEVAKAPVETQEEAEAEPSHEAVGIGIIGRPQTANDGVNGSKPE